MRRYVTPMREGYENIREFLHCYPLIMSQSYPAEPYSGNSDSRFVGTQQQFEARIGRYAGMPRKVDARGCVVRASVQ